MNFKGFKILTPMLLAVFTILFYFSPPLFDAEAIITSPMSNQVNNAGTIINRDKVHVRVKNGSGGTLSTGSVVIWDLTADDGMTVTTTTTAGVKAACVTETQLLSNELGLCQVYGKHNGVRYTFGAPSSNGEATAGESLYTSKVASRAVGISPGAATDRPIGIFYDSSATTGNVEAFINLL